MRPGPSLRTYVPMPDKLHFLQEKKSDVGVTYGTGTIKNCKQRSEAREKQHCSLPVLLFVIFCAGTHWGFHLHRPANRVKL